MAMPKDKMPKGEMGKKGVPMKKEEGRMQRAEKKMPKGRKMSEKGCKY